MVSLFLVVRNGFVSCKASTQRVAVANIAVEPCRRRKIRCILAEGDFRQRCVTCIRLKKTCAFHPPERQHSYTGRFQSSDNARLIVDTPAEKSSFLAGHYSRWALGNGEQLDSSPPSTSNASFSSTHSWFGPWSVPPNGRTCGVSGIENVPTLPFDFQSSLADGWEQRNQFGNQSYWPALRGEDGFSEHQPLLNFMVLPDGRAQLASGDPAAYQPPPSQKSASLPLLTIPFDQTYPPEFQMKPPPAPAARQLCHQELFTSEDPTCQTLPREASHLESMHATPEKTKEQSQNSSGLPLKLDGELYKRRS